MKKTYFLVLIFFMYASVNSALPDGNKKSSTDPFKKFNQPLLVMQCDRGRGIMHFQLKYDITIAGITGDFLFTDGIPLPIGRPFEGGLGESLVTLNKNKNQVLWKMFKGQEVFFDFDKKVSVLSVLGTETPVKCW